MAKKLAIVSICIVTLAVMFLIASHTHLISNGYLSQLDQRLHLLHFEQVQNATHIENASQKPVQAHGHNGVSNKTEPLASITQHSQFNDTIEARLEFASHQIKALKQTKRTFGTWNKGEIKQVCSMILHEYRNVINRVEAEGKPASLQNSPKIHT